MSDIRMPDGTPQYAVDAEKELVGAAMLCESADVLATTIQPEDFWARDLGIIWGCTVKAAAQGSPSIPVTAWELDKVGELDRMGGYTRLAQLAGTALVEQVAPHTTLITHPSIIKDWARRRRGLVLASEMAQAAMSRPHRVPVWDRPEYQGELS